MEQSEERQTPEQLIETVRLRIAANRQLQIRREQYRQIARQALPRPQES